MAGEVFMRPLQEFGVQNRIKNQNDPVLFNYFRADLLEGAVKVIHDPKEDEVFSMFPQDLQAAMSGGALIDVGLGPCNLFCLYRMSVDPTTHIFCKPDNQLRQFGDSAVIIRDFNAFLQRLYDALRREFPTFFLMLDEVRYYALGKTQKVAPLFSKEQHLDWQNEARIVVGVLDGDHPYGDGRYPMQLPPQRRTINIGDIHDIALMVSINQLMTHRYAVKVEYAMDAPPNSPYYQIKRDTQKMMSRYQPNQLDPIFWI